MNSHLYTSTPARLGICVLSLGLGLLHLIISFGNLTDYGTNFAFVQHVLSMDTIFPDSHVQYRAIHLPWMHHLFYSVRSEEHTSELQSH